MWGPAGYGMGTWGSTGSCQLWDTGRGAAGDLHHQVQLYGMGYMVYMVVWDGLYGIHGYMGWVMWYMVIWDGLYGIYGCVGWVMWYT